MGLITELSRHPTDEQFDEDRLLVRQGLRILESFEDESRLARSAVVILRSKMNGTLFLEP